MSKTRTPVIVLIGSLVVACATPVTGHDLVILGGRVIDPETGLDAVRNVGVKDGKIAAIGTYE